MTKPLAKPKSLKAQITRTSLVLAAAALLRERGPEAVTYRKVAEWAGAASSSVGYYFESVTDLLYEAGCYNIELWIARAEKVAQTAETLTREECRERIIDLLVEACLPDDSVSMAAHYAQLIAASEAPVVTEAYRKGRAALDAAVNRILVHASVALEPSVVGALVDGGAVKAISEGYDVREVVRGLLAVAVHSS
ncbi:TetR family transcriptional regulator [Adlercreutzia sp. R21]|uniref:TetR family transcriptional regulator n=1 Tax=Adlercreutzia wanghongyangiae TaxID=3111451 RepID=A0ABU6IL21_9ACTN|nr:TetR family transcriptional regulator [Adlercreutzia sp. R21]MEC4177058.1 TetR family transcriptional regulator [Adlercreutzia sp. R7]MEC4185459.1 TetR family transcriptional regulator [Adlercreutzia sp. R21]